MTLKMSHYLLVPQPVHLSGKSLGICVTVTLEYVQHDELHDFLHYCSLKAMTPGRNSPVYQLAKKHLGPIDRLLTVLSFTTKKEKNTFS